MVIKYASYINKRIWSFVKLVMEVLKINQPREIFSLINEFVYHKA